MKIRFSIAFAVLFAAFASALSFHPEDAESAPAASAKCAIPNFENAYRQAKAVFVGEVVREEKRGDTRVFEFAVEKYWKGAEHKRIEIEVYETARYQAWFKKGGAYLIYAGADENGVLRVARCSRSRDRGAAQEDLRKLGEGKTPR